MPELYRQLGLLQHRLTWNLWMSIALMLFGLVTLVFQLLALHSNRRTRKNVAELIDLYNQRYDNLLAHVQFLEARVEVLEENRSGEWG